MKKFLLILILSVATLQPISAQSYRGFADIEAGYIFDQADKPVLIGVTTTHGVQLAPKFFIGAGSGILIDSNEFYIPLYADFRFDFFNGKKISPFIDLKAGYTLLGINSNGTGAGAGLYLNPTVGFRIRLTERMGINIGLAYSLLKSVEYEYDRWDMKIYSGELGSAISIKAGIDF